MKPERKIDIDKLLELDAQGKSLKELAAFFSCSTVACWKALQRAKPGPADAILEDCGLTKSQQLFVLQKAGGATNTQAALASYEVTSMDSAKQMGCKLMKNETIREVINRLMEAEGPSLSLRIKKLKSHVLNKNPDVSLRGIDLANKMDDTYSSQIQRNMNINQNYNFDLSPDLQDLADKIMEGRH